MNKLFHGKHYTRAQRSMVTLETLALQLGITPAQLALAWVLSHPNTCAIVGADTASQAQENAAAMAVQLTEDALMQIGHLGRAVTDHLDRDDGLLWDWGRSMGMLRRAISSAVQAVKNASMSSLFLLPAVSSFC
jgi:diketogulonate reductase-like aldo/keto reductase